MSEFVNIFMNNSTVFIGAAAFGVIMNVLLWLVIMQLRSSQRSFYLLEENRVTLSKMRESFEARLTQINLELTATRDRWLEVNHILLDAQQRSNARQAVQLPGVVENFGVEKRSVAVDPKLVFFLTPFNEEERSTYRIVRDVCERSGLHCLRGDETHSPTNILTHIVTLIASARLIVANITARNANVMYELGVAHAMGKLTVLISRTMNDVPFDVAVKRVILYKDDEQLEKALSATIINALSSEGGQASSF